MFIAEVGVTNRHPRVGVTEELLQVMQISARHTGMTGESMPEIVQAEILDTGILAGTDEAAFCAGLTSIFSRSMAMLKRRFSVLTSLMMVPSEATPSRLST